VSAIEKLLHGSIDMHVHHGPDPLIERRLDALQLAQQAQQAGMRAVVLKSHEYVTTPVAYTVSQVVKDIAVFGSISLDLAVGGLNTHVVEMSAKLGAKVLWMPTTTSANDYKKKGIKKEGITIFDAEGQLLPVVGEILDIVKSYNMVLATGHLSVTEAFALVDAAKKKQIEKIVITHPLVEFLGATLTLDEQRRMADNGAFIEHCFCMTMPIWGGKSFKTIVEAVKAVGAKRCILSTDLGQAFNPAPAEGMRMMIASMLMSGITEAEIELMVKVNPAQLLGLA
jgi:hypothetical protein